VAKSRGRTNHRHRRQLLGELVVGEAPVIGARKLNFEGLHDDGVGGQGTRERNETAMLTSLHSGTERACDFARTVRNLFFAFP